MPSVQAVQMCLSGLTLLYVENQTETTSLLSQFLKTRVRRLYVAVEGVGLEVFRRERPDLLVCDLVGLDSQSLALIEAVRAEAPGLPVILTTDCEETQVSLHWLEVGVNRFLLKPLHTAQVDAALMYCARELCMAREWAALQKQILTLLQAQNEQALRVLAGGIAHDYNNLLQAVMINVALAKQSRANPDQVFNLLNSAESAWEEIRELGNQLGQLQQERLPFQYVNNLDADLREALDDFIGASDCTLELVLADDLPRVRFNRGQMKVAIGILARNALEAMGGSGRLRVEGKIRQITREEPVPLAPGAYLQVSFSDDGPGIAPEILPVMFCPYTSTKIRGTQRGMGLSLAFAQAILTQHGGALLGENPAGGGATLHLLLPVPSPQEVRATGRAALASQGSTRAS